MLRIVFKVAMCAVMLALSIAGTIVIPVQPVAGKELKPVTLQGAAALDRLKRDGQYASLQAVFNQKLTAADGMAYDKFGYAVAISGDTAVIGANWDKTNDEYQGSVYVFVRVGGVWKFHQKLTASDGVRADNFGSSVAISDETIVVGAPGGFGSPNLKGAAYVFTREDMVWTERQKLKASDGMDFDQFGSAVAISGDTIVVGAHEHTVGMNARQGSAYVFERSGDFWTEQQELTGIYGEPVDNFGRAVAISGDMLAVGTPADDMFGSNTGSVYVFVRVGSVWSFEKYFGAGGVVNQFFGHSVAIDGDVMAVGAYGDRVGSNDSQGSVYVFRRSGTDWMRVEKLTASDGEAWDHFGYSVAISGDTIVVGASYDDVDGNQNQGSAYVFKYSGGVWEEEANLTAYDGTKFEYFGQAVAVSSDTAMAGVYFDEINGNPYQGSVYVFSLGSGPCAQLNIDPQVLPEGVVDLPYSEKLTGSGGTAPYTFVAQNDLPDGLTLSPDGIVSGTPYKDGEYNFRVLITDANGCYWSDEVSVTINK